MTATGLEPRTTQFLNEHSTIWPNILTVCSLKNDQFNGGSDINTHLNLKMLLPINKTLVK